MRCVSASILITAAIALTHLTAALPAQSEPLRSNGLRRPPNPSLENLDADDSRPVPNSPTRPNSNSTSTQDEFKYRLIVQGSSDSLLRQVRQVIPDAFRTTVNGRNVIQAGLFAERGEAEDAERQLSRLDVTANILELDRPILRRPTVGSSLNSGSNQRTDLNYRLVVQGSSDSLLRQVRQITPDAFRTTLNGQDVIQAGLFAERDEAEDVQRQLSRLNAPTNIFDINYGVISQRSSVRQSSPMARLLPPVRDGRIVVVVDPGHGGRDVGAVGIGGIQEASIVLDIAQQVAALLEKQGIQAVLTRTDDREIELEPRVDLAESLNANLFVSIHANSINLSRPDVNGIETYYYSSGGALASTIHNSLVNATGMSDRGVRQARFYVLTRTSMPSVLVEVGFVTGQTDAARLNSSASRSQIAAGIAQGILRYIQQRN